MRFLTWIIPMAVLSVTVQITAACCPLCLAPLKTWSETVADADVVVLAKLVSRDPGNQNRKPSAVFEVVQLLKSHQPEQHAARKPLFVEEFVAGNAGDLFLLTAVRSTQDRVLFETFAQDDAKATSGDAADSGIRQVAVRQSDTNPEPQQTRMEWNGPEAVTQASWDYIRQAPAPDQKTSDRLTYFLPFLEHQEELIAVDAWGEFAKAEYDAIKSLHEQFSREHLKLWIANRDTSPERLSLFGLMLGMCGTQEDVEFLKQQIGVPGPEGVRYGSEGLMGGLLVLAGTEGLDFLAQTRFQDPEVADFEALAAVQAIQFAWNHDSGMLGRPRLAASLHPLLKSDVLREIVIRNLARWEDWTVLSKLADVYVVCRADDPRTTQAIIGYAIVCANSKSATEDETTLANRLREQIRADSPALVHRMEKQLQR